MATLIQQAALAADPQFQARVQAAIVTAAADILAEGQGETGTNTFALRNALAAGVMSDAVPYLTRFCWAAATNSTVTQDIPPTGYAIASVTPGMPATITTQNPHEYASGWNIEIDGCSVPACNGTFSITVTSDVAFTIPVLATSSGGAAGIATEQPSDTDIATAIADCWNAVAGVNTGTN